MKTQVELVKQGISGTGYQAGDIVPVRVHVRDVEEETELKMFFEQLPPTCKGSILQTEVIDYEGNYREKWTKVEKNAEFWGYIELASDLEAACYSCVLAVYGTNGIKVWENFSLEVKKPYREKSNLEDYESLARVKWFQSDFMQKQSIIPAPFTPVECNGDTFSILGRDIQFGAMGLPQKIRSYFDKKISLTNKGTNIINKPFSFQVDGERLETGSFKYSRADGRVEVHGVEENGNFKFVSAGCLEFDGMYTLTLELEAKKNLEVKDISLSISLADAPYFMGLGLVGGKIPENHIFRWDASVNQDGFWAGNVNGGLKMRFRDRLYRKPNVNIYYSYKPIELPKSWNNDGKGTITVKRGDITASTGSVSLKAGQKLYFGFDMWITPFKEIDYKEHFGERYYHTPKCISTDHWLKTLKNSSANIINIHHGTDINPYINYPFYETKALKSFISKVHNLGSKVKIYNTIREMTTMIKEFDVIRTLGYEILEPSSDIDGPTLWQEDAKAWIVKNYGEDIIPAWRQEITSGKYAGVADASVLTNGQSRLCNYYIEGLNYLLHETDIDGIYIDDTAFDRITMKRVVNVFAQKKGTRIDMHSWNHYDKRAGAASSVYQYMELIPYISRLWLGECFDYENTTPEYWLVEMSGIPYGVMSEMLQNGGNLYRGMVFGETNRLGWCGDSPEPIWKLWDDFGIEDSNMLGWWDDACPIKTDNEKVLVTCYEKKDKILIAVASWSNEPEKIKLEWKEQQPTVIKLYAPEIQGVQAYQLVNFEDEFMLERARGILLILEK